MTTTEAHDDGHLDSILESSEAIVVVLDGGLRVLRLSRGARRALGFEDEDVMGLPVMMLVPDDRKEWMSAISKRVREDGLVGDVFVHWKTKDGRRLISKSTLKSVVNYQRDIVGMIISEDISGGAAGEGIITPEQAMDMIHASEIAIIVSDLSGNIISFSSGAEKLTGYTSAQVVGASIARMFLEREVVGDITTKALRDGKVEDREAMLLTPQDERLEISVSVSVRRNPSGAAMGFSFVMFSIARRKELERELEIRAEKLRLVNELATRIRSGKSLKEIYSAAAEGLARLTVYDMMTIISTTQTDEGLRIISVEGEHPGWLSEGNVLPMNRGPFATAMENRKPVVYTPMDIRGALADIDPADLNFAKAVGIPLYAGERPLGLLNFISSSPAAFGPREMDPMVLVANHIALAVESSRLFTALMENINIQTILMETGTAVRSELKLEQAFPLAVSRAQEVVSSNHVALYMLANDRLKRVAYEGDSIDSFPEQVSMEDGNLISNTFFRGGKAFIREVSRSDGASDEEKEKYISVMMAKLVGRTGPMGILYIARAKNGMPFTPYEFELLSLYSNHLAPSLENALLFAATRQSEEKTKRALDSERRTYEALHFMVEMLAHDSLNQIQGISGYLDLIAQSDIPAEVQSYLDKAMKQVKAGSYLISGASLVFKNLDGEKRPKRTDDVVRALQDATHRFSSIFSNVEIKTHVPPLEMEEEDADPLLSELFFHVMRLMHKASGSSAIEVELSGGGDAPAAMIEFRVESGSSSVKLMEALSESEGAEHSTMLLDPFIVRVLGETYGAKIGATERMQPIGGKTDIVCTLEFQTTPQG